MLGTKDGRIGQKISLVMKRAHLTTYKNLKYSNKFIRNTRTFGLYPKKTRKVGFRLSMKNSSNNFTPIKTFQRNYANFTYPRYSFRNNKYLIKYEWHLSLTPLFLLLPKQSNFFSTPSSKRRYVLLTKKTTLWNLSLSWWFGGSYKPIKVSMNSFSNIMKSQWRS